MRAIAFSVGISSYSGKGKVDAVDWLIFPSSALRLRSEGEQRSADYQLYTYTVQQINQSIEHNRNTINFLRAICDHLD